MLLFHVTACPLAGVRVGRDIQVHGISELSVAISSSLGIRRVRFESWFCHLLSNYKLGYVTVLNDVMQKIKIQNPFICMLLYHVLERTNKSFVIIFETFIQGHSCMN